MKRWLIAGCLALAAGTAMAEEADEHEGGATAPGTTAAAPESVAAAKREFEKTERLEALRYQHLWIAYGAAWLIIFGFVWRTWKGAERTGTELVELKRRIADLEGKHHG